MMPLVPFLVAAGVLLLSALLYAEPVLGPPQRMNMVTDFYSLPPPWRGPAFPANWASVPAPRPTIDPLSPAAVDSVSVSSKKAVTKKAKHSKVLAKARYLKAHKKHVKRTRPVKRYAVRYRSRI
jgi:hypothetical protein